MSERYSRVFTLPGELYAEGSPVVIAAGALLKDNQTNRVLAQLKLRSVSAAVIKALTVRVFPLDTVGQPLGEPVEYQYLDLAERRDGEFGQKSPVPLPNNAARSFTVEVIEAAFKDNSVWRASGAAWEPLPPQKPLSAAYGSGELVKQYKMTFGQRSEYVPAEFKDLWFCTCGAVNRQGEDACHRCCDKLAELLALDPAELTAACDARLAKEKQAAEEAAAAAAEKARKDRKLAVIVISAAAVLIAAILLLTNVILPNARYKDASALLDNGQYAEAAEAFLAMGGKKDSELQARRNVPLQAALRYIEAADENDDSLLAEAEALPAALRRVYADAGMSVPTPEPTRRPAEKAAEEPAAEPVGEAALSAVEALDAALEDDGVIALYNAADELLELAAGYRSNAQVTSLQSAAQAGVERRTDELADAVYTSLYDEAAALAEAGDYAAAADAFAALGSYKDAQEKAEALRAVMEGQAAETRILLKDAPNTLAAGTFSTAAIRNDGTVVAVGNNEFGQCDTQGWKDVISLAVGYKFLAGLKADGTVTAIGADGDGQCDVDDWTDIVAVAAANGQTFGLRADGTVAATGYNSDGQCDVDGWTDIVAVAAGAWHTVGLKADGTVVSVGNNKHGQCNVDGWTDIVAVAADCYNSYGLKADGTVAAAGDYDYGQFNVFDWTGIVSIAAGQTHVVGLKADGTVVAVGDNEYRQCDVSGWTDIVAVAAANGQTFGLRADGTVAATGYNSDGQCDVDGWTDVRLPY